MFYIIPSYYIDASEKLLEEILTAHYRWQAKAIIALQDVAKAYIVFLFEDSNLCSIYVNMYLSLLSL